MTKPQRKQRRLFGKPVDYGYFYSKCSHCGKRLRIGYKPERGMVFRCSVKDKKDCEERAGKKWFVWDD